MLCVEIELLILEVLLTQVKPRVCVRERQTIFPTVCISPSGFGPTAISLLCSQAVKLALPVLDTHRGIYTITCLTLVFDWFSGFCVAYAGC